MTKLFSFVHGQAEDKSGSTALHCAAGATEENEEIIEALLEAGADPRKKDVEKMTPIHFACQGRNLKAVKLLFEHVEKTQKVDGMLEDQNKEGENALHAAVKGGDLYVVQMCLAKGAKVESQRANLAQPLHIAAINGYDEIAKLLLNDDALIDARNANHETPLHKAAAFNRDTMVKFLLER